MVRIIPEGVVELLAQEGIEWGAGEEEKLGRFLGVLDAWGRAVQTVSIGDREDLVWKHVVDSVSMCGEVARSERGRGWLDIGSGAGFPGIVGAIAFRGMSVTLVERQGKRAGLLRKVLGACGLTNCRVVTGSFPGDVPLSGWGVVTARAVERPERLVDGISRVVSEGAVFVCQDGGGQVRWGDVFHVEHVEAGWRARGWRRGELTRISMNVPDG
jgi:16S rRNA (guanine527-N7)-methyltransferase